MGIYLKVNICNQTSMYNCYQPISGRDTSIIIGIFFTDINSKLIIILQMYLISESTSQVWKIFSVSTTAILLNFMNVNVSAHKRCQTAQEIES